MVARGPRPGGINPTVERAKSLGVEVFNGSLFYEDANSLWRRLLGEGHSNVWATVGDDYSPSFTEWAKGATSVMVLGESSVMPADDAIDQWNAKGASILKHIRAGEFYVCRGEPIRFKNIAVENSKLVAETTEMARIEFITAAGTHLGVASGTSASYAPNKDDKYVIVNASRGRRQWSESQPFTVDEILGTSGVIYVTTQFSRARSAALADSSDDPALTLNVFGGNAAVPQQSLQTTVSLSSLGGGDVPPAPTTGRLSRAFFVTSTPSRLSGAMLSIEPDAGSAQLYGLSNLRIAHWDGDARGLLSRRPPPHRSPRSSPARAYMPSLESTLPTINRRRSR